MIKPECIPHNLTKENFKIFKTVKVIEINNICFLPLKYDVIVYIIFFNFLSKLYSYKEKYVLLNTHKHCATYSVLARAS